MELFFFICSLALCHNALCTHKKVYFEDYVVYTFTICQVPFSSYLSFFQAFLFSFLEIIILHFVLNILYYPLLCHKGCLIAFPPVNAYVYCTRSLTQAVENNLYDTCAVFKTGLRTQMVHLKMSTRSYYENLSFRETQGFRGITCLHFGVQIKCLNGETIKLMFYNEISIFRFSEGQNIIVNETAKLMGNQQQNKANTKTK